MFIWNFFTIFILWKDIGRKIAEFFYIPDSIILKLTEKINELYPEYKYKNATFCEYSLKYGQPNLPPHFDEDRASDLLLDYQLESNTSWPLFIENTPKSLKSFVLKDNYGHILFPKKDLHGRVDKVFNDEEYVKMIFFYFGKK